MKITILFYLLFLTSCTPEFNNDIFIVQNVEITKISNTSHHHSYHIVDQLNLIGRSSFDIDIYSRYSIPSYNVGDTISLIKLKEYRDLNSNKESYYDIRTDMLDVIFILEIYKKDLPKAVIPKLDSLYNKYY